MGKKKLDVMAKEREMFINGETDENENEDGEIDEDSEEDDEEFFTNILDDEIPDDEILKELDELEDVNDEDDK